MSMPAGTRMNFVWVAIGTVRPISDSTSIIVHTTYGKEELKYVGQLGSTASDEHAEHVE